MAREDLFRRKVLGGFTLLEVMVAVAVLGIALVAIFGSEAGELANAYDVLLDSARFADEHGFVAVWTPERHFNAFGGPFPNPSVTGAAIAAVTERVGIRSGSCVLPLHHPVRAEQALTYDDNPPCATMHGFVNVFLAAALVRSRVIAPDEVQGVLDETDPKAFAFTDDGCGWRGKTLTLEQLTRCREGFCLGYGSCSFTEPFEDLEALGLF